MTTGENFFDFLIATAKTVGLRLVYAALVVFVGLRLIKFLTTRLRRNKKLAAVEPSAFSFLMSCVSVTLHIIVFVAAARILGVDMTSAVALLASVGVAIGLALQGALGNFIGGIMILLFKPFSVGDYIETGTQCGTVREITVFYTKLTTLDNKMITLPNGTLTNASITNYSAEATRRVDLVFSVAYDSDIERVKALLLDTAQRQRLALADPAPTARLTRQNASALDFTLRVWCATADYWDLVYDLNEEVKKVFDENGVVIPFPQLDVHLDQ